MSKPATCLMLDPNFSMEKLDYRVDMSDNHDFSNDEWRVIDEAAKKVGKSIARFVVDSAVASAMLIAAAEAAVGWRGKGGAS